MNGYYALDLSNNRTKLVIYPATEDGESVRGNELKEYLDSYGIRYDSTAVNAAILKAKDEKTVITLQDEQVNEIGECIKIDVSIDKMHVFARFVPPSSRGKMLTKEDIMVALNDHKIVFGINDALIDALLEEKEYCKDYEIASGRMQTAGKDASIKYYFNTDNTVRPTLNEDGSVDFFNLNNINHCLEGDVLAEKIPKEKGINGMDVFGNVLPAREVSDIEFKYGLNINVSADGMRLISGVSGHVQLIDDTVFAADVYIIENVDTATGNIEYVGNVQVNGNVCDNFSVRASGNVEIRGAVEAAKIEAGGDIIIARGIHGQGKGSLQARGNVIAKFLESCTVSAGGFVEAESILHSVVDAKTDINVEARKGFITGGRVCAGNVIKAKNVGSPMGADTVLEVGINAKARDRYAYLQTSVMNHKKSIKQITPVVEATMKKLANGEKLQPAQVKYIQQLQAAVKDQEAALKVETIELDSLHEIISGGIDAHIDVTGNIYSGTRISISGTSVVIKDNLKYCRLTRVGADIKMSNL